MSTSIYRRWLQWSLALVLLLSIVPSLVTGLAGGLMRMGIWDTTRLHPEWLASATALHSMLLINGFFATVISLERAAALGRPWAYSTPLLSGGGALLALNGLVIPSYVIWLIAASCFVCIHVVLLRKQPAWHTMLLGLSSLLWLYGNLALWWGGAIDWSVRPWLACLVLTVVAERIELARLTRQRDLDRPIQALGLGCLLLSLVPSWASEPVEQALFGMALITLAVWLLCFDVARHTVKVAGPSRYMAICLLSGHGWLAISGLGWIGLSAGLPTRDLALHALTLGFIFNMVMGHAPVILPALTRWRVVVGARFYLPWVALQVSLLLRLLGPSMTPSAAPIGSVLNVAALALFGLTLLSALRQPSGPSPRLHRRILP